MPLLSAGRSTPLRARKRADARDRHDIGHVVAVGAAVGRLDVQPHDVRAVVAFVGGGGMGLALGNIRVNVRVGGMGLVLRSIRRLERERGQQAEVGGVNHGWEAI